MVDKRAYISRSGAQRDLIPVYCGHDWFEVSIKCCVGSVVTDVVSVISIISAISLADAIGTIIGDSSRRGWVVEHVITRASRSAGQD